LPHSQAQHAQEQIEKLPNSRGCATQTTTEDGASDKVAFAPTDGVCTSSGKSLPFLFWLMSQPVTRSHSGSSDSRAVAPAPRPEMDTVVVPATSELVHVLSNLSDETSVKGKHAKALRDATVHAINEVWTESQEATSMLTRSITESNAGLLSDLNQSFAARPRNDGYQRMAPAEYSQACFNCGGFGHFARQCPSTRALSRGTGMPSYSVQPRTFDRRAPRSASPALRAPRRDHSRELTEAREQIRALSITLRDNQSALERSEARTNASLSATRSWLTLLLAIRLLHPDLFHRTFLKCAYCWPYQLFLFVVSLAPCLPRLGSAHEIVLIHLREYLLLTTVLIFFHVLVTPPNTQRYDSPAFLCKILTRSVTYSISFFGARYENHSESQQIVSSDACNLMVQHHRCAFGELHPSGDTWSTSNELNIAWPSAPFGCCTEHLRHSFELFPHTDDNPYAA
ncbi:zinc knuckle, partial [Cooperia oncophora]